MSKSNIKHNGEVFKHVPEERPTQEIQYISKTLEDYWKIVQHCQGTCNAVIRFLGNNYI